MYQALYRKYRPVTFDDVVGQDNITNTLRSQVETGRLSHAYLFIGTRGTGKTTCAKILAKAVNCEHPVNGSPCGKCPACLGIEDGSVMDVVEIDAASNNKVDDVRALRDEAIFSPVTVKKRVYIIDEVHMLSTAAFNALLKILEEPPEHLMFILATTELRKVPATILSRCQRYSFRRLDSGVIRDRLLYVAGKERLKLTPDAATLLSRMADGGMRDALSLLDQCSGAEVIDSETVISSLGLAGKMKITELLECVSDGDASRALTLFDGLWRDGKDPASLLSDLCSLMRDVLVLSVAPNGGRELLQGTYETGTLESFAERFTNSELLSLMEKTQSCIASLRDNPSPRTAVELCLVALCGARTSESRQEPPVRVAPRKEEPPVKKETPKVEPEPEPERPPVDERDAPPPIVEEVIAEAPVEVAESTGFSWDALVKRMEGRLPFGLYSLLTDSSQVSGELTDGVLRLQIADGFALNMLNKPDMLQKFRDAATELAGSDISVTVNSKDSGESIRRSVEELKKFQQVKFI